MTRYDLQVKADNIDKILNSSFSNDEKSDIIYAYKLSESIKTDERLFIKTLDERLIARVKQKKEILFSLPDRLPLMFHHITGRSLVVKPIMKNDELINFYN